MEDEGLQKEKALLEEVTKVFKISIATVAKSLQCMRCPQPGPLK
jgi:hypothetical protein